MGSGVAAGLSVSPHSADLDKLELHSTPTDSKAGVLLGFGLRKLLRNLDSINLYKLLNHHHELTTVALLLGLATGHVGDMDIRTAKVRPLRSCCLALTHSLTRVYGACRS